ncbi:hypothetical protein B296_00054952 [Ensete ventricosum]|uniref:Uncharacterized protein n=1 Tax=Ensete ventricosum TaxID=4639 RepID=A0A426WXW9_ENSVE|nr:hypothetical protein B296_00054952 [Ensete ventricosum]
MLFPLQPLPAYHHCCCPSYSPSIVDSASSSIAYCLSPPVVAVLPRSCTVTVAVVLPYRSAAIVCTLLPLPLLSPPPICRLQPLRSVAISSLMPLPTPSPSVHNSAASATVLPTTTHSFLSFSAISVTIAVDTLPLKHQQLRATCCSLPTGRFS